jgi:hypothetical protein
MANIDRPHGLRPLGVTLEGGCPVVLPFTKDASENTAIYIWDIVNMQDDGNIEANSATPGTTRFLGVSLNHGAASTLTTHLVVVSPNALFEAQDNNDTDGIAAADLGLNANVELNAGSTTTLISGHEIDESTAAATGTLDLKLLRLYDAPDNAHGSFARIEVVINKHMYREGAGV